MTPKKLASYVMLLFLMTYSVGLPVGLLFNTNPDNISVNQKNTQVKSVQENVKSLPPDSNEQIHYNSSTIAKSVPAETSANSTDNSNTVTAWKPLNSQPSQNNAEQTKPTVKVEKANTAVATNIASKNTNVSKTSQNNPSISDYQYQMLVRIISAEAKGEPLEGQVAVGAVILNRIKSGKFPDNIAANVLKPGQFEPVANGHIWNRPASSAYQAANLALKGWDPSYGALYFFNPDKSTSRWIWSRPIITQIGEHVFAG